MLKEIVADKPWHLRRDIRGAGGATALIHCAVWAASDVNASRFSRSLSVLSWQPACSVGVPASCWRRRREDGGER